MSELDPIDPSNALELYLADRGGNLSEATITSHQFLDRISSLNSAPRASNWTQMTLCAPFLSLLVGFLAPNYGGFDAVFKFSNVPATTARRHNFLTALVTKPGSSTFIQDFTAELESASGGS